MRADIHVHTRESGSAPQHWLGEAFGVQECYTRAEEALASALRSGMDAIAITNHDAAQDSLRMSEARPERVIPGCEYTVYAGRGRYVHVVVLGIDGSSHGRLMKERRRGLARFTGLARGEGLAFFLAHPAWEVNREKAGIEPERLCDWMEHFDALETLNGNCPAENPVAGGLARYFRKAAVGGSDSHGAAGVGKVWTEAEAGSTGEFLERMRGGQVLPGGQASDSVGFAGMTREVLTTFYRRELLKAVSSGSLEEYFEKVGTSEFVKAAVEFLLLPGLFWVPQAGTRAYFRDLARGAERLRSGLVDLLTLGLARSLAADGIGAEERANRWVGGMRAIYSAFERGEPGERAGPAGTPGVPRPPEAVEGG